MEGLGGSGNLSVQSGGHCFLCLNKVPPQLLTSVVKIDPDGEPNPDLSSEPQQPFQSVSEFYPEYSLQYLLHYLRLGLEAGAGQQGLMMTTNNGKAGLNVVLCEGCGDVNGRFSELYQQLEKVQMQLQHYLRSFQRKLTEAKAKETPDWKESLETVEICFLERLRRELMQTCLSKLERAPPSIKIMKLDRETLQQGIEAEDESLFCEVAPTGPVTAAAAKSPKKRKKETSNQPDIGLKKKKRRRKVTAILPADMKAHSPVPSPSTVSDEGNETPDWEPEDFVPEPEADDDDVKVSNDDASATDNKKKRKSKSASPRKTKTRVYRRRCSDFKRNPDTGKYKCTDCDKEFSRIFSTSDHYRRAHLKVESFVCDVCGKQFSQKCSLNEHHQRIHLQLKPHQCEECGTHFRRPLELRKHRQTAHTECPEKKKKDEEEEDGCWTCNVCGKQFYREKCLEEHQENKHLNPKPVTDGTTPQENESSQPQPLPPPEDLTPTSASALPRSKVRNKTSFDCARNPITGKGICPAPDCDKEFMKLSDVFKHYQAVHLKVKSYACQLCDHKFTQSSSLSTHHRVVHLQLKPHPCEECGMRFGKPENLRRHREDVHHEILGFKCGDCGKRFYQQSNLTRHQETAHSESEPGISATPRPKRTRRTSDQLMSFEQNPATGKYKCSDCEKEFNCRANAELHYQAKHAKLKSFTCDICGKQFALKSYIDQHHQAVHLQLKPYQCDECGMQFRYPDRLQRHRESVHLQIKSYSCDECGKAYVSKHGLLSHQQSVHLKLKPYSCDQCGKSYSAPHSLKVHTRTAHQQTPSPASASTGSCPPQSPFWQTN